MCVKPNNVNGLLVSCRECWQCIEVYKSDWTGRCIAESEDALQTHLVTLTYNGGDHLDARILNYEHIRQYFRNIRNKGHKVRYFCVGEYGALKGRAHWHALLFWQSPPPIHTLNWAGIFPFWDHGNSLYEKGSSAAARYIMKYMTKNFSDPEFIGEYGMSSHPLLGHKFYRRLAGDYVKAGLAPQDKKYRFPEVTNNRGNIVEFHMSRNVWLFFCQQYLEQWFIANPGKHRPTSPMLDDYEDLMASRTSVRPLMFKPLSREPGIPWLCPRTGREYRDADTRAPIGWSDTLRVWFYPATPEPGVMTKYWSFSDEGKRTWRNEIRTEAWAERRQAVSELRKLSGQTYETLSRGS